MTPSRAEPKLPKDPAALRALHLRIVLLAGVFRLLEHLIRIGDDDEELDAIFARHPILAEYYAEAVDAMPDALTWKDAAVWWREAIVSLEKRTRARLPLRELAKAAGDGVECEIAAVLVGCVEDDLRLGALIATLQGTPETRRPCVALLEALTDPDDAARHTVARMIDSGWLELDGSVEAPRGDRQLRLPPGVWEVLRGRAPAIPGVRLDPRVEVPPLRSLILEDGVREEVEALPKLLGRGGVTTAVFRGMSGVGRTSALCAVARSLRRDPLLVDWKDPRAPAIWPRLGPVCRLHGAMPIVRLEPGPGEAIDLTVPRNLGGPIGVVIGRFGGLRGGAAENAVHIDLPKPREEQRLRFWARELGRVSAAESAELAELFHVTGGAIERASRLATGYAALRGAATPEIPDVRRALAAIGRHAFDELAQRLEPFGDWTLFFTAPTTSDDLGELQLRCRHREALGARAGPAFRGTLGTGVRALFSGPTGTGKTLAARILASQLGLEIYRVDLASVVNKYIGETEKNLNRILSRAEELDVVLLLDEGDSLMSTRTDVRSSNDRYANLETNYLLQRLESYEGIVVVTTNAAANIDTAFLRRLDAVIDFPPPAAAERLGIWSIHLPSSHTLGDDELRRLATRAPLTGGQIRNAALHATLLATGEDGQGEVGAEHVEAAVRRELRRAGAVDPTTRSTAASTAAPVQRLDTMIRSLR